jgi:hypothetical protein
MARDMSVQPNKGIEPIAYSLRFAAASGNGSALAFGTKQKTQKTKARRASCNRLFPALQRSDGQGRAHNHTGASANCRCSDQLSARQPTVGTPANCQYFRQEHTLMNPLQRLWQWLRERRVERHAFRDHTVGRRTPSQTVPPLARGADPDADALRLRLRKSDPGPRIV